MSLHCIRVLPRPVARAARRRLRGGPPDESGQISLLIAGLAVIALILIVGTVAVSSAHLSRMRLLDSADGAALAAANALDESAYQQGLGESVPLTNESVRTAAAEYLADKPVPARIDGWTLLPGTGSPDGRTAVVVLRGTAELPLVGGALRALGGSVTITVESRARADLAGP
jgi:hypothetical protein